jgi:hypothetical protein
VHSAAWRRTASSEWRVHVLFLFHSGREIRVGWDKLELLMRAQRRMEENGLE